MSQRVDELVGGKSKPRRGQDVEKCPTCGEDCALNTIHCEGSRLAYGCLTLEPHHGKALWPACWRCKGGLGCSLCVPGGYQDRDSKQWRNADLVCKRCRVKASLEALLNGGPISQFFVRQGGTILEWGQVARHTPDLTEYPPAWARIYAIERIHSGLPADEDDREAMLACRKAFEELRLKDILQPKGHYALLREKNRQAEQARQKTETFQATDDDLPKGCWDEEKPREEKRS